MLNSRHYSIRAKGDPRRPFITHTPRLLQLLVNASRAADDRRLLPPTLLFIHIFFASARRCYLASHISQSPFIGYTYITHT